MRLRTAPVALATLVTAVAAATVAPLAGVAAAGDGGLPHGRHDVAPRKPVVAMGPVARPLAEKPATCELRTGSAFPLDTKVQGGPEEYVPGGGSEEWSLDLTNTSDRTCDGIHPVLVLVDRDRTLNNAQLRMEFDDPVTGRSHPVPFIKTDEDEHIGVFDDGFPGFVIGAGRTVTVRVRLGFTADTVPGPVTATAAIVQRRGGDGQWVGESGEYRFDVVDEGDLLHELDTELAATGAGGALTGLGAGAAVLLVAGGALLMGARRLRAR
ncbi:hypothetical protein [Streptomyces sp. NBC_00083]|uniref:hypothetical protein n=1 Tax=Streptomyces sp. NBC_00083 TaxID=2975647 RepID=UPI002259231A|nr:hypothetical protein [Streptomyces sp. NBC_00083]MCX5382242.1 hypothetical protein [Streptomyces sp. NBC_00083]